MATGLLVTQLPGRPLPPPVLASPPLSVPLLVTCLPCGVDTSSEQPICLLPFLDALAHPPSMCPDPPARAHTHTHVRTHQDTGAHLLAMHMHTHALIPGLRVCPGTSPSPAWHLCYEFPCQPEGDRPRDAGHLPRATQLVNGEVGIRTRMASSPRSSTAPPAPPATSKHGSWGHWVFAGASPGEAKGNTWQPCPSHLSTQRKS